MPNAMHSNTLDNLKIARMIMLFIAIHMMDDLATAKTPPELFLGDKTMLISVTSNIR